VWRVVRLGVDAQASNSRSHHQTAQGRMVHEGDFQFFQQDVLPHILSRLLRGDFGVIILCSGNLKDCSPASFHPRGNKRNKSAVRFFAVDVNVMALIIAF
jgi:hypothetical protein